MKSTWMDAGLERRSAFLGRDQPDGYGRIEVENSDT